MMEENDLKPQSSQASEDTENGLKATTTEDSAIMDENQIIELCNDQNLYGFGHKELRSEWKDEELGVKMFKEGTTNILVCCWPSPKYLIPDDYEMQMCQLSNKLTGNSASYKWSENDEHGICTSTDGQTDNTIVTLASKEECGSGEGDIKLALPLIVRFHGRNTSNFIDRNCELHYLNELSKVGLAAPVVKNFSDGLVYEYTPGITLKNTELCQPLFANAIIKEMVKLHESKVPPYDNNESAILFPSIRNYIAMLHAAISTICENEVEHVSIYKEPIESILNKVNPVLNILENYVTSRCDKSEIVMCHNDLLDTNIIFNRKTKSVQFIDFEYSGYNYASYDVANHLNEYAGMTDGANFSLIPSRQFISNWCKRYLLARKFNESFIEIELDTFVSNVEMFMNLSHLSWSLWSLLQALYSTKTFSYYQYGVQRFQLFWKKRYLFE